ncbi:MAG: 2-carboxy-1,4-naphthoquinone phytyltransferase [Cyanobacteria bacterium J06598_3]
MTTQTAKPTPKTTHPTQTDRKRLWMAAIKPPMYCVAIMPICVGTTVAYSQTGTFRPTAFITFALSAILLLVWENLSNDVYDATTGIDKNKHHSLVNLTQNRPLIFWLGNLSLLLGITGIFGLALAQQDFTILFMVLTCCALGYLYQGPPFRLGYQGLGEILCFFSFGPLAVGAAYYAQTQRWRDLYWGQSWSLNNPLLPAAIIVGVATTLVLFCSHFHQIKDDLQAGKKSPIVRLGTQRGAQLLPIACGGIYTILGLSLLQGGLPISTLVLWGALPTALRLCRHVMAYHDQPQRVSNSKFLAIHFHFWSGLLLIVGLLLPSLWSFMGLPS